MKAPRLRLRRELPAVPSSGAPGTPAVAVGEVVVRHPGAAIHRGGTLLPDGSFVALGPSRGGPVPVALEPTGCSRRVRGIGRRMPVLAGYSGGPIPVDTWGTVRVGVNWRAVVLVLVPWLVCAVVGVVAGVTGRQGVFYALLGLALVVGGLAGVVVMAVRGAR